MPRRLQSYQPVEMILQRTPNSLGCPQGKFRFLYLQFEKSV